MRNFVAGSLFVTVLTSLLLFAGAHKQAVTYGYEAKGNNQIQLAKDLEACKQQYTKEYMPKPALREMFRVQCMVIDKGHGFIQIK